METIFEAPERESGNCHHVWQKVRSGLTIASSSKKRWMIRLREKKRWPSSFWNPLLYILDQILSRRYRTRAWLDWYESIIFIPLFAFLLVPCTRNRFFSSTYTNGRLYVRRLANLSNGASRIQFFVSGSFFLISLSVCGGLQLGCKESDRARWSSHRIYRDKWFSNLVGHHSLATLWDFVCACVWQRVVCKERERSESEMRIECQTVLGFNKESATSALVS